MLEWFKTPKKSNNGVADIRTWRTKCGRFKVEESKITGLPTKYRLMQLRDGAWEIRTHHRKLNPAKEQAEYYA